VRPRIRGGLVILPTYNEKPNVSQVVPEVLRQDARLSVLVVDDYSPDGTYRIVREIARNNPRVGLLLRRSKQGLGRAYVDGFAEGLAAGYDVLITMDADLSHQPTYLPTMLEEAAAADVVIGSRYVEGGSTLNWALHRRLLSRGGNAYARTVLGLPVRDCTSGFVLYRRRVLESIPLDEVKSEGYSFLMEVKYLAYREGFLLKEIPIVFAERRGGRSKISKAVLIEAVWMVWKLRCGTP
jgi:dolichol-phosphate mannosyltransferase